MPSRKDLLQDGIKSPWGKTQVLKLKVLCSQLWNLDNWDLWATSDRAIVRSQSKKTLDKILSYTTHFWWSSSTTCGRLSVYEKRVCTICSQPSHEKWEMYYDKLDRGRNLQKNVYITNCNLGAKKLWRVKVLWEILWKKNDDTIFLSYAYKWLINR